jgi:hypothetical protein
MSRIGQHRAGRSTRWWPCLCAPPRCRSSGPCAAGQHRSQPPRPYNLPVPLVLLPKPRGRRNRARGGRVPWAPPAGQVPAPLRRSAATNRLWVSPSSFPTPSPAKPATGAVQFRPEPPPPWPRDYIASLSFFPGCFSWTRDLSVIETRVPGTCQ